MTIDFTDLIDLASERVGGVALAANDEFFAPKENLLKPSRAVFREDKYTDRGKWMDGWETRRRREPGFDWCLVRLGIPGAIEGVIVDTSHFRGNFPEGCSIECCERTDYPTVAELTDASASWQMLLERTALTGDSENRFAVRSPGRVTHLRLNIFPDGGVARLRVFGRGIPDWERVAAAGSDVDLAAAENGAVVVTSSDMFFGSRHNLIMPSPARHTAEGWETRRRRGPGHDWTIIRLARRGTIRRIEVDTTHFKGNAPGSCSLDTADASPASAVEQLAWREVLSQTKLLPHTIHRFDREIRSAGLAMYARFNIFPDGGVCRLRLFGTFDPHD